jgi:hypothetical protein
VRAALHVPPGANFFNADNGTRPPALLTDLGPAGPNDLGPAGPLDRLRARQP